LLVEYGGYFMADYREKWQRIFHPGHKTLNLLWIVDHDVTGPQKRIGCRG